MLAGSRIQSEHNLPASKQAALERFLKRISIRSPLTQKEKNAVLGLTCTMFEVRARRDFIRPGEKVEHACLVGEGLIGRFDQMAGGRRQITALYIPGDMCDLPSVVIPTAAWGMTALSDSVLYRIPHEDLRRLVVTYPNIAMAFWRDVTVDAAILSKWITNIAQMTALAKIAHLFCELGMRMEAACLGKRDCYALPLSQAQLADVVGLTSVHVNRVIQKLRATGTLTMQQYLIEILDWDGFTEVAEFSPDFLLLGKVDKRVSPAPM